MRGDNEFATDSRSNMTEEELFHAALAKPRIERSAFLDQACSGNTPLRAAVEALLAAHEASGSFLNPNRNLPAARPSEAALDATWIPPVTEREQAATGVYLSGSGGATDARTSQTATTDFLRDVKTGAVIGDRYTLQEKIGEGGMGEVWVAKQTEPVKRRVALKLIKTGMDSRSVVARFDQERQALAMMDHPNIASVLDGGMTSTGQPYFVMELVNGLELTKFCDEAKLTPKQRLELFIPICQAVQHAHQKGLVHRDLKPANILVTMIDGRPAPKVIDFGVAKATGANLTEEAMVTQFGAVVGTLEYMAPEQAGYSGVDVDTRADIYSLGVILYELLTGLRPIDGKRLRKAALTKMIRMIMEEEPSKPSTRLSTDEALASLAALRQTEPNRLMAMLRGELDWVVMKCLEKQRDRRYETANALARDVQRYLADEPVEARPPSTAYRFKKFVRRNKLQVIAASLILLSLLAGISGTTWQWIDATNQRNDATNQRNKAREAEALAKRNESKAKAEQIKAIDEANKARIAQELAQQESHRADRQRLEAETAKYAMQLKLADIHRENSELPEAHSLLDETKPDFRNWEYDLVKQRCDERMQFFGTIRAYVAVAVTPDGKIVAGGGKGGTVELFDYSTRKLIAELKGNWSYVLQLAFSPDGKRLACATDTTMCVWDVDTRQQLGKLEFPVPKPKPRTHFLAGFPRYVAFDAAGNRLALGLEEEIQIWDASLSEKHRTIKTEPGTVRSIAFDPIRDQIAVLTSPPQEIKRGAVLPDVLSIYHAGSGERHQQITVTTGNLPIVTYDPLGRSVLVPGIADRKPMPAWDPETGNAVESPLSLIEAKDEGNLGLGISRIAFNADGSRVALASFLSDSVYVLNGKSGKLEASLRMPVAVIDAITNCSVNAIAMSADGKRIVVGTASVLTGISPNDVGRFVGLSIDGDSTMTDLKSNTRGQSVPWREFTICEKAGWIARPINYPNRIIGQSMGFGVQNPTEHFLVEFDSLTTGELLFCLRRNDRPFGRLVASHDGQSLLEFHGSTIEVWNPVTRQRTRTIHLENSSDQVLGFASLLSPDDTLLATVEGEQHSEQDKRRQRLVVRDFRTGKVLWQTEPGPNALWPRDFSVDGSQLLISTQPPKGPPIPGENVSLDYKIRLRVFDARSGGVLAETRQTIPQLGGGQIVAPGRIWFANLLGLYLWETASGEVTKISDHGGIIDRIRNGTRVIVSGHGAMHVIDVATMQEVFRMPTANRTDMCTVVPSGNVIMILSSSTMMGNSLEAKLLRILPSKQN
jgi:serine/threonine protein kinase/WD40 repeat protein